MKTRSLLAAIALFMCSLAWGQAKPQCTKPTPPPPAPTPVQPVTTVSSSSTSSSSSTASSNQTQSQTQSAQGGNAQASSSNNGSNVAVTESTPRQAPPAYAPPVFPGTCLGGFSAGASAPVGGLSFGGTKRDKNCEQMQAAAMFISQGNLEAAARILCRTWAAKDAKLTLTDCRIAAKALPLPLAPIVVPVPAQTTVNVAQPAPQVVIIDATPTVVNVTPTMQQLREAGVAPKAKPVQKKVVKHNPCPVTPIQQQCPVK